MMKKGRGIVHGMLIAIVIAALAGCGQKTDTAQTAQAAQTTQAEWLESQRFPSRVSEEEVTAWVDGLGL